MAKWANSTLLRGGLDYMKNNVDKIVAVAAYTAGDSYATVTGGSNVLAEITTTSTDFTVAGSAGAAGFGANRLSAAPFAPAFTASKHAFSESKTRAGPRWCRRS